MASRISRAKRTLHTSALSLEGGGPYVPQAAIAGEHARSSSVDATDWARIAALYGALRQATGSAVVELNRAVAVAMAHGPRAGLAIVDEIEPALPGFHLVPAVRGDLFERLGRHTEAAEQFDLAARLAVDGSERALMHARAGACRQRGGTTRSLPGSP